MTYLVVDLYHLKVRAHFNWKPPIYLPGKIGHIKLYAINGKSGVKLWEFKMEADVYSSPVIGSDGTVYVGSIDGTFYAIKTNSKGPAKSPWPMRGQNAQRTGRW